MPISQEITKISIREISLTNMICGIYLKSFHKERSWTWSFSCLETLFGRVLEDVHNLLNIDPTNPI